MPGKRFKAEEIVNKLRQADVELARGNASKTDYKQKKQAYMEAKTTLQQFNISSDSEDETPQIFHDSDSDSNVSDSTEYYSEAEDSNTS